jgi:hypothetical protein
VVKNLYRNRLELFQELMQIIKGQLPSETIIHTDSWKSYDGFVMGKIQY